MNEKGYSLVVTMLIITIFLLLGLTIMSVAIYQARFTEVRVEDIESFHEATNAIEETIAEMKARIDDFELSTPGKLDMQLNTLIPDLQQRYGVDIKDVTDDYKINRATLFTRVYLISKPYGSKTVERRVILTNTPSFLKYAIGSTKDVILNGGAYIDGNIYAGGNAYVTNVANYIDNSKKYMEQTSFPTTSKTSVLFVNGSYYSCDHENGARTCYNIADNYFQRLVANYSNDVRFQSQAPSIQKEREEFIDVDFEWTVKDKLLNAAGIETFSQEYETYIDKSISQLFHELQDRFAVFDSVSSLQENIDSTNQSIILQSEDSPLFFLDQGELDLQDKWQDKWLIVNGDLFLGNSVDKSTKFRGNIIVLGNLTISGDIELDSTIYVFGRLDSPNVPGRTLIYNANIAGWDDKEVVLLSKGRLEIARINEFENNLSLEPPNLKGYFYTESNATVYAVGSYINIQGGLFARGDTSSTAPDFDVSGLVINAYRGAAEKQGGSIIFTPPSSLDHKEESRFVIRHDPSVFINRGKGLPFVKKLSLVVDKLIVK
ncbi:hypothetical protein DER53_00730 [Parageobacillus toebii NBRC 107807]|uniref:Uncharacterized protein n=1 Tax=Parageobacillus toebii NBRC 107807 TaxID=1223503 RepID=A0A6G9IYR7_9BACL|nr:hypothetical protein [Parageobacillus toebii]MBB3867620.1 hypothetical protein [Parageobacillus toebii NBRC 107807]MED4969508.1 hypothetical protein [Parageobacillus toebii]QIQ31585.1 hypothetical protein DER53_00730 [Parageobacillus toebii NBRC 107807]QSB49896.1 hypothetical protein JTI59_06555 [Parageobacillus toebii]